MGNCCGKPESDNFSSPGRVVGSAPEPTAKKTSSVPRKVGGPARTLGGSGEAGGSNSRTNTAASGDDDARRRAAEAAEARAKATNKPGGKLQNQLSAQKRQTRTDTLKEASEQERRAREADEAARASNWD